MKFAKNFRKIRKSLGISQEEMAKYLDVSQRTISHYENGETEPELIVICRLAYAFNMSIESLLGYDGAKDDDRYEDLRASTIKYIEKRRQMEDEIRRSNPFNNLQK